MIPRLLVLGIVLLVAFVPLAGCDDDDPTPSPTTPASHTVSQDGIRHMPGLRDPENECTTCHGADLRGDGDAPSCFACHGREW